jgi:hypothetical protein
MHCAVILSEEDGSRSGPPARSKDLMLPGALAGFSRNFYDSPVILGATHHPLPTTH